MFSFWSLTTPFLPTHVFKYKGQTVKGTDLKCNHPSFLKKQKRLETYLESLLVVMSAFDF